MFVCPCAAAGNLQIYNLEMKTKMKATVLEQAIVFWRWLDPKTIAIVTETAVLHWSMDGEHCVVACALSLIFPSFPR
jgi:hypothetical protein